MEKFDEFVKKIRNDLIGSAETIGYGHIVVLLNIKILPSVIVEISF